VLRDDASGLEAPLGMSSEGRLELVGPAEDHECVSGHERAPFEDVPNQLAAGPARRPARRLC
jgi:hypothetical protein